MLYYNKWGYLLPNKPVSMICMLCVGVWSLISLKSSVNYYLWVENVFVHVLSYSHMHTNNISLILFWGAPLFKLKSFPTIQLLSWTWSVHSVFSQVQSVSIAVTVPGLWKLGWILASQIWQGYWRGDMVFYYLDITCFLSCYSNLYIKPLFSKSASRLKGRSLTGINKGLCGIFYMKWFILYFIHLQDTSMHLGGSYGCNISLSIA